MANAELKTKVNDSSVKEFIDSVTEGQKREDSYALIKIMQNISGHPPKMWGSSIIGFDQYHYKYESGREGDMPIIAFSPRKQNFALYVLENGKSEAGLLDKLGKYKTAKVCLYINALADVDLDTLRRIIQESYKGTKEKYK